MPNANIRANTITEKDTGRVVQIEEIVDDINTVQITTSTGEQPLAEALDHRIIYVNTINDLLSLDTTKLFQGQQVLVHEYHEGTGVGGGIFSWDASSTEDANGGTVLGTGGSGRFLRPRKDRVLVSEFGAEDSEDINTPLQKALEYSAETGIGDVIIGPGVFTISQEIKVPSNVHLKGSGIDVTTLIAHDSLPVNQNVITNASNDRLERTTFDENIHISNMTVDGNAWGRSPDSSGATENQGTCVKFSTVRNSSIRNVRAIRGVLHCIDVMASTYFNGVAVDQRAVGPSLNVLIDGCTAEDPQRDDGITTHDSGEILIRNCRATMSTSPPGWTQQGIEIDDGSFQVTVVDCYSKGYAKGFQAKGHENTAPAVDVVFERCVAEECAFGFTFSNGGDETPRGYAKNITMRDCTVRNMVPHDRWEAMRIVNISGYTGVLVDGLSVFNQGNGRIAIDVGASNTVIKNVRFYDASTEYPERGVIHAFASTGENTVTLENIHSYAAQEVPLIRASSSATSVKANNIHSDGTSSADGMIRVSRNLGHEFRNMSGDGWNGHLYIVDYETAYSADGFEWLAGERKNMSIPSGDPEGVHAAPPGTMCYGRVTGRLFRKDSGSGSTGWLAVN